jgi:hypothetical protein
MAMQCRQRGVGHREERHGSAGAAAPGTARQGLAWQRRQGTAGPGRDRLGKAGKCTAGRARLGKVWHGAVGAGMAGTVFMFSFLGVRNEKVQGIARA